LQVKGGALVEVADLEISARSAATPCGARQLCAPARSKM